MAAPWRTDPDLAQRFHPEYPDDLQIVVHDGEPRRTQHRPEACWVRVTALDGELALPRATRDAATRPLGRGDVEWPVHRVYRGTLLNEPHQLSTLRAGETVTFVAVPGAPHPLQVRPDYLAERARWAFVPCDRCGCDQGFDPPTIMARTRFPDAPPGTVPIAFSAFCNCGGTMLLSSLADG